MNDELLVKAFITLTLSACVVVSVYMTFVLVKFFYQQIRRYVNSRNERKKSGIRIKKGGEWVDYYSKPHLQDKIDDVLHPPGDE